MGNTKVDLKQLEEFRDRVQKAADEEQQRAFMEACAKELAARLLAKVIKRTPVGDYSDSYDVEDDGQQKNRAGFCAEDGQPIKPEAVQREWKQIM